VIGEFVVNSLRKNRLVEINLVIIGHRFLADDFAFWSARNVWRNILLQNRNKSKCAC